MFTKVKIVEFVNSLEEAIAAQLESHGLAVSHTGGPDLIVSAPTADGVRTVVVETKHSSMTQGPGKLDRQPRADWAEDDVTHMLAQRYISPRRGQSLRAQLIPYVDTVGNMWLQLPGLYIHVEGRPAPSVVLRPPSGDRLSRPSSLRITFALLTQPLLLQASLRELAEQCGTSVGAAQAATTDLTEHGFVTGSKGDRRLTRPGVLADRWVHDFGTRLLPKLEQRTLRGPSPRWWLDSNHRPSSADGSLGGETACELLGYPLRAEETLFYGRPPWGAIRKAGRLAEAGEAAVTLRERFWPAEAGRETAPSLLVLADLMLHDDPRLHEMTDLMRRNDDELRRLWTT